MILYHSINRIPCGPQCLFARFNCVINKIFPYLKLIHQSSVIDDVVVLTLTEKCNYFEDQYAYPIRRLRQIGPSSLNLDFCGFLLEIIYYGSVDFCPKKLFSSFC